PVFDDPRHHIRLYQGDCLELLAQIPESSVDLVFANPPYSLSNGGITGRAGKMEVGRISEDEVHGGFGDLGEEFEAVALIEADVVAGVVENRRRKIGERFGHWVRIREILRSAQNDKRWLIDRDR